MKQVTGGAAAGYSRAGKRDLCLPLADAQVEECRAGGRLVLATRSLLIAVNDD